jgi:hypothetical protein
MLFDLRGAGRRNMVKAVYLLLAILMGAGLIGFGIGGSGLGGGLVDALTGSGGSSADTGTATFMKRAQAAQRKAEANPKDPAAWADATRARYQVALTSDYFDPNTQQFNAGGKAQLRIAAQDWQRHLALNPKNPDDSAAGIMVKVYSPQGLNDLNKMVAAQEVITQVRPKSRTFATLAVLAYQAGQTRKGDLARQKALDLADPADRATLKSQIDQEKQQALQQQLQNAAPTATATATPTPAAGGGKKNKKSSGKG